MTVNVIWWNNERMSFSCCNMLNEMFDGAGAVHHTGFGLGSETKTLFPDLDGAVVVFHGGNAQLDGRGPAVAAILSAEVADYDWVIFVSIGDEASEFPLHLLVHPNMKIWAQSPKPGRTHADRYLIEGYPADQRGIMSTMDLVDRDLDFFFAGQITHQRRIDCFKALQEMRRPGLGRWEHFTIKSVLCPTQSFGAGLSHETYYLFMKQAKVIPCPAGPATPDSFRMAEALEAGCVPLLDGYALDGVRGYWDIVFGKNHPFWVIEDWSTVEEVMEKVLANWEAENRACQFFWRGYKLGFRQWLIKDLISLGAI
jgi:hypothetical protein